MFTSGHAARSKNPGMSATIQPAPLQTVPAELSPTMNVWAILPAAVIAVVLLMAGSAAGGFLLARAPAAPAPLPEEHAVLSLAPGVTMTLVRVPAGAFLMGSPITDTEANDDEKPQRRVYLDEFWVGQYEVTNSQYDAFARAAGLPWRMPPGEGNFPATNVSWIDATAFCQWASQVTGRRILLPTEAQWEKAARGSDGRVFPWGNENPDETRLNFDLFVKRTSPVGQYSPLGDSPYGAADMLGNVWEWTSTLYWPYPYRTNDGREEPLDTELRVLRGGSFVSARLYARSAVRGDSFPSGKGDVIGFRVSMAPAGN